MQRTVLISSHERRGDKLSWVNSSCLNITKKYARHGPCVDRQVSGERLLRVIAVTFSNQNYTIRSDAPINVSVLQHIWTSTDKPLQFTCM